MFTTGPHEGFAEDQKNGNQMKTKIHRRRETREEERAKISNV